MKKKLLSALLVLVLCVSMLPMPALAAATATPKAETVYVNLTNDGNAKAVYIVNAFEVKNGGSISDFGNYSAVANLTDTSAISNSGGQISAQAAGETFYYQGTLAETALPWDISVEYYLDGKKISAEELGGKSGAFELRIRVKSGDSKYQSFYERYMMQISLSLNKDLCANIVSEGATINTIGKTASISITHAMNTESTYSVTANVHDFEMGAITFRAAAMGGSSLNIDLDGVLSGFDPLVEGASTLNENAGKLVDGSKAYNSGLQTLNSKTGDFASGIRTLYESAKKLNDGAVLFGTNLGGLAKGLGELTASINTLNDAAKPIMTASATFATQLDGLNTTLSAAKTYEAGDAEFDYATSVVSGAAEYGLAQAFLTQNATLKATKNAVATLNTANVTLNASIATLSGGIAKMQQATAAFDESNIKKLTDGYAQIQSGIDAVYKALGTINTATSNELVGGISTLASSYKAINDGIVKLTEAIAVFDESAAEIPDMLREKIDELIGGNNTKTAVISFASPKSEATSVMFIMQTEGIEKAPAIVAEIPTARTPETFWEKLLNLFGLFRP